MGNSRVKPDLRAPPIAKRPGCGKDIAAGSAGIMLHKDAAKQYCYAADRFGIPYLNAKIGEIKYNYDKTSGHLAWKSAPYYNQSVLLQ